MKVLVIKPDQNPVVEEIGEGLEAMQSVVGGYIQAVYPWGDGVAVVCNEEGKLCGLPLNRFIIANGQIIDCIAGDFFLCYAPPECEHFQSLPDDLIEKYSSIFGFKEERA